MPATHAFKETRDARIAADAAFRRELLREAVEVLLSGDLDTGRAVLRDYIAATVGFERLSERTHKSARHLMRKFERDGHLRARDLFDIVAELQKAGRFGLRLALEEA